MWPLAHRDLRPFAFSVRIVYSASETPPQPHGRQSHPFRHRRAGGYARHAELEILHAEKSSAAGVGLLFLHFRWVEVFFTPIVWTGYLFGAVWVGFILLLDPINHFWGGRSLLRDLEQGDSSRLTAFLCSGLVCGILWEFWNYWAGAKWLYVFPVWQNWKVFEMPVPGYLGFPPFAVECLVMYEFLHVLRGKVYGV